MARRIRIQFPGAFYHIVSRGNHDEAVFRDDTDRQSFLSTLDRTCQRTSWRVHAFCLLADEFQLLVETPQPNLVLGMKWLLGLYTNRYNRRHQQRGHLFAGRYRSVVISPDPEYLIPVSDFVHLSPDRARLLSPEVQLSEYPWSSLAHYVGAGPGCSWLTMDRVLDGCGGLRGTVSGRRAFGRRLEQRRAAEGAFSLERGDWCYADARFKSQLLKRVEARLGRQHYGQEVREVAVARAERIAAEELKKLGWTASDLARRPKGDMRKLRIAVRLRAEATVTLGWIAERLRMGTPTYLAHLLYWDRRRGRASARARGGVRGRGREELGKLVVVAPGAVVEGAGIDNTILRTDPSPPTLFDPTFD